MKAVEIRALNEEQLEQQLTDLHVEWRTLRFQEAVGRLSQTSRIGQIRRDIARIHTIRTERQMDAQARAQLETTAGRQSS
jgi:large subunit ribosomal protein L29